MIKALLKLQLRNATYAVKAGVAKRTSAFNTYLEIL